MFPKLGSSWKCPYKIFLEENWTNNKFTSTHIKVCFQQKISKQEKKCIMFHGKHIPNRKAEKQGPWAPFPLSPKILRLLPALAFYTLHRQRHYLSRKYCIMLPICHAIYWRCEQHKQHVQAQGTASHLQTSLWCLSFWLAPLLAISAIATIHRLPGSQSHRNLQFRLSRWIYFFKELFANTAICSLNIRGASH